MMLIFSTVVISAAVIVLMQFFDFVFPAYVLGYTLILSSTYLFSFWDMLFRIVTCDTCGSDDPIIEDFGDDENLNCAGVTCISKEEVYVEMNDIKVGSDRASDTDESADSADSYHKMKDPDDGVVAAVTVPSKAAPPPKEVTEMRSRGALVGTEDC
jgi:hypothetical protein